MQHTIVIKVLERDRLRGPTATTPIRRSSSSDEDRTDVEDIPQIELPAHQVY